MAIKTRLDVVVKLRERAEDEAQRQLAQARAKTSAAEGALAKARERALADGRGSGDAALWHDADLARQRALREVEKAKEALRSCKVAEEAVRKAFEQRHREAEAVRRVAEARREEIRQQQDRAERKVLDELAAMGHGRR
ncbi:MAG: flagellar FliJ family protein [Myxococcales bacterium]